MADHANQAVVGAEAHRGARTHSRSLSPGGARAPRGASRVSPIFVAIDTPDVHRAAAIARDVLGVAGGVKLGLEFFCANGDEGVRRVAEREMPIFLDLKFHDIPNTVGKAVEAIAHLEPAILTVHAAGGRAMMQTAKAAAPPETKVVAVTVLTSLDESDLSAAGVQGSPADQVRRLADLARE